MATSKTFLTNAAARHVVFVQRFAGSQLKDMLTYINRIKNNTARQLAGKELTAFSRRKLESLYKELDAYAATAYEQMAGKLTTNLEKFSKYEAEFSSRMFDKATNVEATFALPGSKQLNAAIFSAPLLLSVNDQKGTIESALKQFSEQKRKEMVNVIKDGVVAGKTTAEIVQDVTFTADKIQANHANALVRTIVGFVSTQAREETFKANEDLIDGYQWVSVLDGRTTETCMSLDGRIFAVGDGPRPPIHWGCRSTVIPVVKPEFSIKDSVKIDRPAVGEDGPTQVDSRTTYNSWLNKQSAEFQNEVLGPERAALFRDGGLNVSQFVDENYKPLTLDELKKTEPLAFEKAGLNEQ